MMQELVRLKEAVHPDEILLVADGIVHGCDVCSRHRRGALYRVADELLSRPDQLEELGRLARQAVGAIRGASARNVDHMLALLPTRPEHP